MDDNVAEYCSLDKNGRRPQRELTLGEKEQLFLEAMMVREEGGGRRAAAIACRLACLPAWLAACCHCCCLSTQSAPCCGCERSSPPQASSRPAAAAAAARLRRPRRCRGHGRSPLPPSRAGRHTPAQAYYYEETPTLSNEEFDNLKQELQWEGSKVVILT